MTAREKCDAECIDGFSAKMWGVWPTESAGGDAPIAVFRREDLAHSFLGWLQSGDAGEHQVGADLCVLPVVVTDAVVHNCHVGNDSVHLDAAGAWKIERRKVKS